MQVFICWPQNGPLGYTISLLMLHFVSQRLKWKLYTACILIQQAFHTGYSMFSLGFGIQRTMAHSSLNSNENMSYLFMKILLNRSAPALYNAGIVAALLLLLLFLLQIAKIVISLCSVIVPYALRFQV